LRVAVTGGTGFVGAALIDKLLQEGHDVIALARDPSRLRRANDVRVLTGDLDNGAALEALATGADAFLHLAGVILPKHDEDFDAVNVQGAANAAAAAAKAGAKFIHISSMTARLPDASPYALSKHRSEDAVKVASAGNPWLALRLPAIYGPGDLVTLPYFKLVRSGFALEPKTKTPACVSLLYVEDAAAAIIAAATEAAPGAVYEVGDERARGFAWSEIGAILGEALDVRPKAIQVPRPIIAAYHSITRSVERGLGRTPSVRTGQTNEFFHPDWVARDNLLTGASSWRPTTPLKVGFAKTIHWYQENGLL